MAERKDIVNAENMMDPLRRKRREARKQSRGVARREEEEEEEEEEERRRCERSTFYAANNCNSCLSLSQHV